MPATTAEIEAKEAELTEARAALESNFLNPVGGGMRTKSHGQRIDAAIHRGAQLGDRVRRLEAEAEGLRRQGTEVELPPVTAEALKTARLIRTKRGWYEVVKVNRATVKVVVERGMDDLIKASKILEVR